jgi:hypothetical protein
VGGKITFTFGTDGSDELYGLLLLPNGTDPAQQIGYSEIELKAGKDPTPGSRLDPTLGAGALPAPPRPSPPPMPSLDPPEVGYERTFNVMNAAKNGFWNLKAKVLHVDDTAVWWFNGDSQYPSPQSAGVTPELLDQLSQGLHQVLMPRLRGYFGYETGGPSATTAMTAGAGWPTPGTPSQRPTPVLIRGRRPRRTSC